MKIAMGELVFPKDWSLETIFETVKEHGFEGFELWMKEDNSSGFLNLNSTKEEAKRILDLANKFGLELPSLACGLGFHYPMTASDPQIREKGKQIICKQIELASYLGCDTILVVPGYVDVDFMPVPEVIDYEDAYNRIFEGLDELKEYAEAHGVAIGIENVTNKVLISPLEMRDMIDKVGSEYIGSYFDVGNALCYGVPEQWARILGKRIKKIHIKDIIAIPEQEVDLLTGEVNYPAVMSALKQIRYDGWLVAELVFNDELNVELTKAKEAMEKIRRM